MAVADLYSLHKDDIADGIRAFYFREDEYELEFKDTDMLAVIGNDHEMTEERLEYEKEKEKTRGFDVNVSPNLYGHGIIQPLLDSKLKEGIEALEIVERCSKFAINCYNEDNGNGFEFVKVVKAAYETCCTLLYVTFEAKQGGDQPPETFQAVVFDGVNTE